MTTVRAENIVQIIILLAIGGMAAAASFTHIHDLTTANGQPSWFGWANATVLELMSIAAGLEIRRRKRCGQPAGFVLGVLVVAVAVSLAAQVAEAKATAWGWILAALPALGFLASVKIVLSRTAVGPDRCRGAGPDHADRPDQTGMDQTTASGPQRSTVHQLDLPSQRPVRIAGPVHDPIPVQQSGPVHGAPDPDRSSVEERPSAEDEVQRSGPDRTMSGPPLEDTQDRGPVQDPQPDRTTDREDQQSGPVRRSRATRRSGRRPVGPGPDRDRG